MRIPIFIASLLLSATGFSQTISTEAPSVSASAVTVQKGGLQGEFSVGVTIDNEISSFTNRNFDLPFLLVRYGLTDRFELRLQGQSTLQQLGASGDFNFRQWGIGAKYALLPNDGATNLAVIANFTPYVESWQARTGDVTLAFSHSFEGGHSIGSNLGYSIFNSSLGDPNFIANTVLGSLVYGLQFHERFTVFGEGFYYFTQPQLLNSAIDFESTNTFGVDFGLQFLLRDNIQLDYVSGFNLNSKQHFHSLGFNILLDTQKN